jgi:hypothetical protein
VEEENGEGRRRREKRTVERERDVGPARGLLQVQGAVLLQIVETVA